MKRLNKYRVVTENGEVMYFPAFSEESLIENWSFRDGNIAYIEPVPELLPSSRKVAEAMECYGCSISEIELVTKILSMYVDGTW